MKKIIFTLSVVAVATVSYAQMLTPQVISSAGTSFVNGADVLDWTIGEPVTSTLNSGSNQLSQGFHQNDLLITSVGEFDNLDITVFPNPTAYMVNIQFSRANETNLIELFSVEGKLLSSQTVNSTLSQVDLSKFSNGTYLLKITNKNTKDKTYQIIKSK